MAELIQVANGQTSDASHLNQYAALYQGGVVFDVRHGYGAAGDATTDDTAAIQAAIDDCRAAGGGVVYFPPGDYKITAALSMGLAVGITLQGSGRDSTIIRQFTRDIPIVLFDTADANGDRIADLTLMYDDWQLLTETNAIALCFKRDAAGSSLFWHMVIERCRINRAQTCVGYAGTTGTQVTYDMTWRDLHLQSFSFRAFDLEATNGGIGQPGHRFENLLIEILNIIPSASAILWFQGLTNATLDNIVIANARNALLYAFGGSHIHIRGLHVEPVVVTTDYIRIMGLGDAGSLVIESSDIEVTLENSDVAWFAYVDNTAHLTLRDLKIKTTRNPGQLSLVRCDDSTVTVRLSDIDDTNGNMLLPFDPSQTTWAPQLQQFDNTFPAGEVRLGYDVAEVRVLTGTGSPEGVVTANPGSLYIRTNGAASTSLYVKGSGTGNTGWASTVATMTYPATVLADSPAGYWRLGESAGTNAVDAATGHDGTYVGTPTLGATGALAGSSDTAIGPLNGTGQYVTIADHADLDLADVFTLEAWVKIGATGARRGIIGKGQDAYYLYIDANGRVVLYKGWNGAIATSVNIVGAGFHHIVATKDGATVHLYIDGADDTGTVTNQTCANNAVALMIGADPQDGTPTDFSNATIDEVAVYPTALTPARVLAHYTAGITG